MKNNNIITNDVIDELIDKWNNFDWTNNKEEYKEFLLALAEDIESLYEEENVPIVDAIVNLLHLCRMGGITYGVATNPWIYLTESIGTGLSEEDLEWARSVVSNHKTRSDV